MAKLITSLGSISTGGAVLTASDGTKLALIKTSATDNIELWSDLSGTPTLEDNDAVATIFGGGSIGWIHAAIDSSDNVHIVAACTADQTRDIAYCIATYSGGSWTFGTWEEAAPYTNGAPTHPG